MPRIEGIIWGAQRVLSAVAEGFKVRVYLKLKALVLGIKAEKIRLSYRKSIKPIQSKITITTSCALFIKGLRLRLLGEVDDLPLSDIDDWDMRTFDYVKEV